MSETSANKDFRRHTVRLREDVWKAMKQLALDRDVDLQDLVATVWLEYASGKGGSSKSGVPPIPNPDAVTHDRCIMVTGTQERELAMRLLDILRKFGQPAFNVAAISLDGLDKTLGLGGPDAAAGKAGGRRPR